MQETRVRSLGQGDPLEKNGMATYSNILAWRISWTEESSGLQSMGLQRIGHDWATTLSLSRKSWYSSWKPKDQKMLPSSGSGQEQHKQQMQMPCGHVEGKFDLDAWSLLNSEQVAQGRGHRGGRPRSHRGLWTVKGSHVTFTAKGSHYKGPKSKWNEVPLPSHCVSPAQHRLQTHASQDCRFPGHRDVGPAPPISAFLNYIFEKYLIKTELLRTSLVVQWLRLWDPNAGGPGLILDQGTRSHRTQLKIPQAVGKMEDPVGHS